MIGKRKSLIALAVIGYTGAALFYSHLTDAPAVQFLCLVCPHIDGIGNPYLKFAQRVLVLGTLNAGVLVFLGLVLFAIARPFRSN